MTFHNRDKTLHNPKQRETGQTYVDGLLAHYNFFGPATLETKQPTQAPGAELPFQSWEDVATAKE